MPAIEISLIRERGADEWCLDGVKFAQEAFRLSVVPTGDKPRLSNAFSPQFLDALAPYLPLSDGADSMLASSVCIELPELVLGKMRAFFTNRGGRIERMMVRFQQALGDLQTILVPKLRNTSLSNRTMEIEAARALFDLLHPCLDLADVEISELTQDQYHLIMARLVALKSTKAELGIFSHLLRRFLERTKAGPAGALAALQSPEGEIGDLIEMEPIYPRYQPITGIS
ncbi:hypothetical protein E0K93_03695 [Puniceibacterium sp. HSS470]|nr:hypothetical protein [Pseudooceanicola sediminis]KAA2317401.1 hypothetical protein E0K93_03695 [Puniceibacterium sp. HSS470]